jgi:hypothetical protein
MYLSKNETYSPKSRQLVFSLLLQGFEKDMRTSLSTNSKRYDICVRRTTRNNALLCRLPPQTRHHARQI